MFPFTTLLVPLEIARAYAESFFPGPSITPKLSSCQAHSAIPFNSPKPMSTQFYDTQVSTVYFQILFTKRNLEAILHKGTVLVTSAMADNGFASWQISLFVQQLNTKSDPLSKKDGIPKPAEWTDDQAIELAVDVYPSDAPPVERVIGLEPENLKYLKFDYQVISTFDRKPPRYDAEQVDVLRDIADAIRTKH
jgi:hypothetical protein